MLFGKGCFFPNTIRTRPEHDWEKAPKKGVKSGLFFKLFLQLVLSCPINYIVYNYLSLFIVVFIIKKKNMEKSFG